MSLRSVATEFAERTTARASRALAGVFVGFFGKVVGFNPADGTIQVAFAWNQTQTQWMPYLTPWGAAGYGFQGGIEVGTQVLVLQLAPDGDAFVAIGCRFNDPNPVPGAPAGEFWITDKRSSSVKLTADGSVAGDGQAGAHVFGAGYASLSAGSGGPTELGQEGLDPIADGVARQSDLQALANAILAIVQPGSGFPPGTVTATGSQSVRAAS